MTDPCAALHALGMMLCLRAGEAPQDPLALNGSCQRCAMPARPVQKSRLMEDNQPLVASLVANLGIY